MQAALLMINDARKFTKADHDSQLLQKGCSTALIEDLGEAWSMRKSALVTSRCSPYQSYSQ